MSLSHTVTVFIEIQVPGLDYVIPFWTITRNCGLASGLTSLFAENVILGITNSSAMSYVILFAYIDI